MSEHDANGEKRPAVRPAGSVGQWHSDAVVTGVMIGTPAYGGLVTTRYFNSAIGTSELLNASFKTPDGGVLPIMWVTIDGESLVERARNHLVAKFMAFKPELSHCVFVDADIEWQPRDLLRLIAHDVDVMFGIYPKKTEPVDFPFHPLIEDGVMRRNPVTAAIEIARGSTGFMCVKRQVFERMAEEYPRLKLRGPPEADMTAEERRWYYGFFDAYIDDGDEVWTDGPEGGGILWSEDYGFCNRWRAIGGRVWCDPTIELGHVGVRIYHGSVSKLFKKATTSEPQPADTERIFGWLVPKNDPWFCPMLRQTGGIPDRTVIADALDQVANYGCAVDVGGHIGTWTRPLAASFEHVVTLEPNPAMQPLLAANVEGLENVKILQAAAWDTPAVLRGYAGGCNSGEFSVFEEVLDGGDEDGAPISGICIDDLKLENVGLIKIDVEGSEVRVLEGAKRTILACRPVIVVEEETDHAASSWLKGFGMIEVSRRPIMEGHPKDNVVLAWQEPVAVAAE